MNLFIVSLTRQLLELRSVDHIVLDCPYQLSSRGEAEGLVLKWCLPCFICKLLLHLSLFYFYLLLSLSLSSE